MFIFWSSGFHHVEVVVFCLEVCEEEKNRKTDGRLAASSSHAGFSQLSVTHDGWALELGGGHWYHGIAAEENRNAVHLPCELTGCETYPPSLWWLRLFAGAPMQRNRCALLQTIKAVLQTTTTRPSRQEGHCLVTYIWSSCLRAKISFLLPTGPTWQLWLSCLYRLVWAWMRSGRQRAQRRWGIEIAACHYLHEDSIILLGKDVWVGLRLPILRPMWQQGVRIYVALGTFQKRWVAPMLPDDWCQWFYGNGCPAKLAHPGKALKLFVCFDFTSKFD